MRHHRKYRIVRHKRCNNSPRVEKRQIALAMGRHKRKPNRPPQVEASGPAGEDHGPGQRLQKVLAAAGVGSRRDCEELIREGRVAVDGKIVTELGTRVDPARQEIRVDGEALRQPKLLYYAVNKPIGVVTTNFDPSGRSRVIDLVPTEERVFAVGRLDRSSEGLILVTNDGEFANRITHPRYGVEKTYLVRVAGSPTPKELARLRKGIHLAEGFARVQSIAVKKRQGQSTDLLMVLNEGRNRELRRLLARVGHKVLKLRRIAVGNVKLADLPVGAWRRLMPGEVEGLLHLAREKRRAGKGKKPRPDRKPGVSKPVGGERPESPYIQKQALMAEPLSLDDLLRDDLDEGPLDDRPAPRPQPQAAPFQQRPDRTGDQPHRKKFGKPGGKFARRGKPARGRRDDRRSGQRREGARGEKPADGTGGRGRGRFSGGRKGKRRR